MSKPILYVGGTLVLVLLAALGWAMQALGEANKEAGRLEGQVAEAVTANTTNLETITELEAKVDELRSRRLAEQARADAMALELEKQRGAHAERVQALETEMAQDREDNDAYREWTECPFPGTTTDRLRRAGGGDGDKDSGGSG